MKTIKIAMLLACLYALFNVHQVQANVLKNGDETNAKEPLASVDSSASDIQKLDVNTATAEQLVTIKGIGPARAAAIIRYRKEIGGFKSIDELVEIRGIGPKALDKLKAVLKV